MQICGGPLKTLLDLAELDPKTNAMVKDFAFMLDIVSFDINIIGKIVGEEKLTKFILDGIKKILKTVAEKISKIGWIGKAIGDAILGALDSNEDNVSTGVESNVTKSLRKAQKNINKSSKENGKATMVEYEKGISLRQKELQNRLQSVQNTSLKNARSNVNSTAKTSGEKITTNIKTGAESKESTLQSELQAIQNNSLKNVRDNVNTTSRSSGERVATSNPALTASTTLAQKVSGITPTVKSFNTSAYCSCQKCCGKTNGFYS